MEHGKMCNRNFIESSCAVIGLETWHVDRIIFCLITSNAIQSKVTSDNWILRKTLRLKSWATIP